MAAYFRPENLGDALEFAQKPDVVVAAGFTDLYPAMGAQVFPGPLLDVTGVSELRGFRQIEGLLRIGAATTWSDLIAHDLPAAFDAFKAAAREVGSLQIQNAGTLGGNICNASPAADGVPCLLTLDAGVELADRAGRRVMALADFIQGPRKTALRPGEIMTAILVPNRAQQGHSGFSKLGARAFLVISIAMVAARLVVRGGKIDEAAVSIGACNDRAIRLHALEQHLVSLPAKASFAHRVPPELVAPHLHPITDIRADANFRADVAPVLIARLLDQIIAQMVDHDRGIG